MVKTDLSNFPVVYIPNFVENSKDVFNRLYSNLEWVETDLPRKEYYCNDHDVAYTYGRGQFAKTYHRNVYTDDILDIRKKLESLLDVTLDVCFLNRYDDLSDHIGWHADDSPEMDDSRPIVTVSLGAEREIWFKSRPEFVKPDGSPVVGVKKLENGSACIMLAGMQNTHLHRIPKNDRKCEPRISLTFRGYVKPQ